MIKKKDNNGTWWLIPLSCSFTNAISLLNLVQPSQNWTWTWRTLTFTFRHLHCAPLYNNAPPVPFPNPNATQLESLWQFCRLSAGDWMNGKLYPTATCSTTKKTLTSTFTGNQVLHCFHNHKIRDFGLKYYSGKILCTSDKIQCGAWQIPCVGWVQIQGRLPPRVR